MLIIMQRYRRNTCTWDINLQVFNQVLYEKYKVFYEDTRFFYGDRKLPVTNQTTVFLTSLIPTSEGIIHTRRSVAQLLEKSVLLLKESPG